VVGRQNADIADTLQLRDVAMATTFWLLMYYNFSCIIASDTLFDSWGEFSGQSYPMKTQRRSSFWQTLPWQPFFGFLYMGCTLDHLAKTT